MAITVVRIMVLLPLFTLICCAGGLAELCRVVITQPAELSASVGADSVVLPCSLQHSCPNTTATVRWLRFYHSSHQQLSDHPPKYNLQDQTLTIQSPLANDSGIYYCAVDLTASQQQGAPSIGSGTLLVVTDRSQLVLKKTLLWLLFSILALYSSLILILLICKKAGCESCLYRVKRSSSRTNGSTRRLRFHAVVQELYRKRNLHRVSQRTSSPHTHQREVEHPHSHSPDEDVYQNM